ncbi:hypothetical protein SS05631_c33800 [Sinorhizobium sp. CCBAU 05631]|nr:hypothetical protein SS05631_c33800 [Sinorhizobium sp. CCBAU 05631]
MADRVLFSFVPDFRSRCHHSQFHLRSEYRQSDPGVTLGMTAFMIGDEGRT